MLPSIKDLKPADLSGKTVWLRVDFNAQYRIDRSLATIDFLRANGAKIILGTHLSDQTASLEPVINYLASKISLDGLTILPNLRTFPGEEANSEELAREWAASVDLYVNEAFAVSHRAHASVVGLPKFLPHYAGFNFMEEVEQLSRLFTPVHPSLLIVGGGKIESKQPVIDKFLVLVDKILIGGALVKVFLDNKNDTPVGEAGKIIVPTELVREGEKIVDVIITDEIKKLVKNAKRIIWAGPMGIYDHGYPEGTLALAEAISNSNAESIIGGGDTIAAIPADLLPKFTFVSTGGGAMLQFLATGTLPGIEALKY
ncbi:MAG: phosphoglycerate kinase [bacterium]|nr:phosphoglycerate kinase [bacterium]